MVDKSVVKIIREYLRAVSARGIPVTAGILFGSYVKGKPNKWSEIDLLVVSSHSDNIKNRRDIDLLWHVAAEVDSRIEPVAVGEKQYKEDNSSWIIAVARREGQIIPLAE